MPYIDENRRLLLTHASPKAPETPGDLAYILTINLRRFLGKTPDYARYAAALGVLESVTHELYRRQVAPYEDGKIDQHGDVW